MLLNAGVLIFFRNFKWTWRCKCQAPSTGNCDDRQREDQPQRGWLKQRIIHKIIQLCHGHENDGFFLRDSTPINDRLLVKLTGSQTVFFLGEKQTEITLNWFMEWSGWYLISSGQMKHCRSSDLKVLISFINDTDLPNLQVDVCYACVLITKSVHAFRRAFLGRGLLEGQDYTYRADSSTGNSELDRLTLSPFYLLRLAFFGTVRAFAICRWAPSPKSSYPREHE